MVNPERGEVELTIDGVSITLAPEMQRFAALSHQLGTKSLQDLLTRINGLEPYTMYAFIDSFAVGGDVKTLKEKLADFSKLILVQKAALEVVVCLSGDDTKNGKGEAGIK